MIDNKLNNLKYIGLELKNNKIELEFKYKNKQFFEEFNKPFKSIFFKKYLEDLFNESLFLYKDKVKIESFIFDTKDYSKITFSYKNYKFNLVFDWKSISIDNNLNYKLPDSKDLMAEPLFYSKNLSSLIKKFKKNRTTEEGLKTQIKIIFYIENILKLRIPYIISILSTIILGLEENDKEFLKEKGSENITINDKKYTINFELNKKTLKVNFNIFYKEKNKTIFLIKNSIFNKKDLSNYILNNQSLVKDINNEIELLTPLEFIKKELYNSLLSNKKD